MPTGISGLYKNTKGAKIARGEKIKQTNFDRIKAMSVEEMADFLDNHLLGHYCNYDRCMKHTDDCEKCIKAYLESEVQEDET